MFKLLAMQVRGLMERLFMGRSLSMEQQLLLNAKPLRANTTQASLQPVRNPASKKPKAKSSTAQVGTTAISHKPKQKPAQPTSGETGLPQATPASQPASKSATRKRSVAQSTTVVKSRKAAPKPAQTTSGKRGRPRKIPA